MDKIKCGRHEFELQDGDTIMDNSACLQLTTRKIRDGWSLHSPMVSKKEFKRFCEMENTSIDEDHDYGKGIILWIYSGEGEG